MTTLTLHRPPDTSSSVQPLVATPTKRRFRTILAIHRGEVYVPCREYPESGWLVRATAGASAAAARPLRTAA